MSFSFRTGAATSDGHRIPVIVPARFYAYTSSGSKYSLTAAADFLAEAGFDGVDLSYDLLSLTDDDDGWQSVIYAFGNRVIANGLSLPVAHLPFYMPDPSDQVAMGRFAREIAKAIRSAASLSIPDAVLHPIVRHSAVTSYDTWFEENKAFLSPLRDLAGRLNLRLCIENMVGRPYGRYPDEIVYGTHAAHIRALADELDTGLCWDTGHGHITGLCQSAEIQELGERLSVIHVHDNDGARDSHGVPFTSRGASIDWDDTALGLRMNGYADRAGRCIDMEIKTADLPADRAVRLRNAAETLAAARRIAALL